MLNAATDLIFSLWHFADREREEGSRDERDWMALCRVIGLPYINRPWFPEARFSQQDLAE